MFLLWLLLWFLLYRLLLLWLAFGGREGLLLLLSLLFLLLLWLLLLSRLLRLRLLGLRLLGLRLLGLRLLGILLLNDLVVRSRLFIAAALQRFVVLVDLIRQVHALIRFQGCCFGSVFKNKLAVGTVFVPGIPGHADIRGLVVAKLPVQVEAFVLFVLVGRGGPGEQDQDRGSQETQDASDHRQITPRQFSCSLALKSL